MPLHVRVFIQQEHGNKMCRQALDGLMVDLRNSRREKFHLPSRLGRVKITERGRTLGGKLPSVPCAWAAFVVCALALAGGTCASVTPPHAEKAGRPSPQLVLARAVRAQGFPFSATQTVFSGELLPAFAQQWARESRTLLGPPPRDKGSCSSSPALARHGRVQSQNATN